MASIHVDPVITAAYALARAGHWTQAAGLLDATAASDAHEAGALAAARADVEADHAFWTDRDADAGILDSARRLAVDDRQVWTVDFARLRSDYAVQLRARIAGTTPDEAFVDELAGTAARLARQAPDSATKAYATFYRGVIAGNLRGDEIDAERHYRAALDTDDEYVRSYALRHVGAALDDAGRPDEARELWHESTRLRQRVGFVPGVLAQLALQNGGATPLVAGWAEALGIAELLGQTAPEPD